MRYLNDKNTMLEQFEKLERFFLKHGMTAFGDMVASNTEEETRYKVFLTAPKKNIDTRFFEIPNELLRELDDILHDFLFNCMITSTPAFISVVTKNTETETEYSNIVWGAKAHDIELAKDYFEGHILIANGFKVMIPEEENGYDKFDYLLPNIELTNDQITMQYNLLKGHIVVAPNEYLELDMNDLLFDDMDEES